MEFATVVYPTTHIMLLATACTHWLINNTGTCNLSAAEDNIPHNRCSNVQDDPAAVVMVLSKIVPNAPSNHPRVEVDLSTKCASGIRTMTSKAAFPARSQETVLCVWDGSRPIRPSKMYGRMGTMKLARNVSVDG